ncbi:MAG: hypothetical protein RLY31_2496 [Bacteroidota bacterium]|jgi:hypothetical protein
MRKILVAVLLISGSITATAQLPINGTFRLGDTTQQQVLHMRDGSQLMGRILRFDEARLGFLFRQRDTLQLPIAEIDRIEVVGTKLSEPPANGASPYPFQYSGFTKGANLVGGELIMANRTGFRLRQDDGKRTFIYWKDTDSLYLVGPSLPRNPDKHQVLTTDRGDRFSGILRAYDGHSLRFELLSGNPIQLVPKDISQLNYQDDPANQSGKNSAAPDEMPGQVRMYVSPTGFLLRKQEREFRTVLVSNTFDYGASEHLTIGGGFSTVIVASMFQARAKFGGSIGDRIHLAGGVQLLGLTTLGLGTNGAGIAYGAVSLGNREKFLNLMVGKGISLSEGTSLSAYALSGSFRIATHFRIFGEYLDIFDEFQDGFRSVILGSSWFRKGNQIDFGFWMSNFQDLASDGFVPFPIASYSYRF